MKSVYIVNGNGQYRRMFEAMGWEIAPPMMGTPPALIQFTGGEDVTPWLYGEPAHRTTHYNIGRDIREMEIFGWGLEKSIPMAGICRGGQFLNVMCGGRMWQDVNNHAIGGTHSVQDVHTFEVFEATSTHHQMMRAGPSALIVGRAYPDRSNKRSTGWEENNNSREEEHEILFYDRQKVLCFQPHPEFAGHDELRDRYFGYLTKYLGV